MGEIFICFRCLAANTLNQLREGAKIGKESIELSRRIKMCKGCKSRTFYYLPATEQPE